jgi:hypothetical protein
MTSASDFGVAVLSLAIADFVLFYGVQSAL